MVLPSSLQRRLLRLRDHWVARGSSARSRGSVADAVPPTQRVPFSTRDSSDRLSAVDGPTSRDLAAIEQLHFEESWPDSAAYADGDDAPDVGPPSSAYGVGMPSSVGPRGRIGSRTSLSDDLARKALIRATGGEPESTR